MKPGGYKNLMQRRTQYRCPGPRPLPPVQPCLTRSFNASGVEPLPRVRRIKNKLMRNAAMLDAELVKALEDCQRNLSMTPRYDTSGTDRVVVERITFSDGRAVTYIRRNGVLDQVFAA